MLGPLWPTASRIQLSLFSARIAPWGWAVNWIPYSSIELYLAGLIHPEEVPDLWVAGTENFYT